MLDKYEKELLKKQREEEKKSLNKPKANKKEQKPKKKLGKVNITLVVCCCLLFTAVIFTLIFPNIVAKFSVVEPQTEVITPEVKTYTNDEENNIFYVQQDTYYAYGIKGVIDNLENYYGYQTQETQNGIREELHNTAFYLSASPKDYEVLNTSVENPEFYILFRVKEKSAGFDFDALFSLIYLRNKETGEIVAYYFEKPLKAIIV